MTRAQAAWLLTGCLAIWGAGGATAAEVRRMRAEPEQPGVGQPFTWIFEFKTKWHESNACEFVLTVDGQLPDREELRPTLDVTPEQATLRQAQAHGRPNWRWQRQGAEVRIDWAFDAPGLHRLTLSPNGASCGLDRPAELTVQVQPDYSALDMMVVGEPDVTLTHKLDNSVAYLHKGGDTEVIVARRDIERWRRTFERYQPGSWDEVQWPAISEHLVKLGARRVRLRAVDDWEAAVRDWPRGAADRLLIVSGTEFSRLAGWKASGQFSGLVSVSANVIAKYYVNREAQAAEQARQAALESRERTARVRAALPGSAGQVTALRRLPVPAGKATVCARRMAAPVGGDLTAYRKTDAVATWLGRPAAEGFDDVFGDLEALYLALKQARCNALVLTDAEALTVAGALERDQVAFELFELRDAEALLPAYAAHYGYASVDDARMARRFSPMPDGPQAAALRAADIHTPDALAAVWQRQQKLGYPGERTLATAVAFLADESQGRRSGQSAVVVRRKREAAERAAAAADRERQLKAYPYTLELSCRNGSSGSLPVAVCFSDAHRTTLAELQNCVSFRPLGYPDLARDPVHLSLCPKFAFKTQNLSEFLLVATLRDERTGQILERQTAQRFGRIVMAR